jgi:phosphopantothenoylcysteine synthetase/decarboxylase
VVVCGARPAVEVRKLIDLAHGADWDVFVVATPSALPFLDVDELASLTGSEVRTEHRAPSAPRANSAGRADAVIVAPATFNVINKMALGLSDNYALSVLAEAIGRSVPVVVVPFVNAALAGRRPFVRSVADLRAEGVTVLTGDAHAPGAGDAEIDEFPWHRALVAATG